MWSIKRKLVFLIVSIFSTPFSTSFAEFVQYKEWAESDVARLYPTLVCDWEAVMLCSGKPVSCLPPREAYYPSLLIDFTKRTIDVLPGDPRPFEFVSGSISDRDFDGRVGLMYSGRPFNLNFFEPKVANTKIRYAFTVSDEQDGIQIQFGSCQPVNLKIEEGGSVGSPNGEPGPLCDHPPNDFYKRLFCQK